jgi:hypothetical protein
VQAGSRFCLPETGTAVCDDGPRNRGTEGIPIGPYASAVETRSEDEQVAAAVGQARRIFLSWENIDTLAGAEGRIHFAGEHTAWTEWMQGALESARRVVMEIGGV